MLDSTSHSQITLLTTLTPKLNKNTHVYHMHATIGSGASLCIIIIYYNVNNVLQDVLVEKSERQHVNDQDLTCLHTGFMC